MLGYTPEYLYETDILQLRDIGTFTFSIEDHFDAPEDKAAASLLAFTFSQTQMFSEALIALDLVFSEGTFAGSENRFNEFRINIVKDIRLAIEQKRTVLMSTEVYQKRQIQVDTICDRIRQDLNTLLVETKDGSIQVSIYSLTGTPPDSAAELLQSVLPHQAGGQQSTNKNQFSNVGNHLFIEVTDEELLLMADSPVLDYVID